MTVKQFYRLYTEVGLTVRTKMRVKAGCRRAVVPNPDEFMNVEVFFTPEDVREKLTRWPQDYILSRPHIALIDCLQLRNHDKVIGQHRNLRRR